MTMPPKMPTATEPLDGEELLVVHQGGIRKLYEVAKVKAIQWLAILNKPIAFTPSTHSHPQSEVTNLVTDLAGKAATAHTHAYADITSKPSTFTPSTHTHIVGDVTGLQTVLDGKAASSHAHTIAQVTGLQTALDGIKRIDTYTGTTDANGLYTVTYPTAFAAVPTVQPEPPALPNQVWTKVSSTTTGFSIRLSQRNTVNLLSTELLLGTTVNVSGAAARVSVIQA